MNTLKFLNSLVSALIFFTLFSCKEETIVNPNTNKISPQEIYYMNVVSESLKVSTHTVSTAGTNNQLVSSSYGIISEPHQNKMLTAKFDSSFYLNNLTVMTIDGTNPVTLPISGYYPVYTSLSPDASKILFTCDVGDYLFVINSNGTGLTQISNYILGTEQCVDFSPDSKKIAFVETQPGTSSRLVYTDLNGANNVILKDSIHYQQGFKIDWSKDGSKIAFQNTTPPNIVSIYTINIDGTNFRNLTNGYLWDNEPAWSPDGNYLAYFSTDEIGQRGIFIINADGSNKRIIVPLLQNEYFSSMYWHLSGKKILFIYYRFGERKIKIYDHETYSLTTLTTNDSPLMAFWNYTLIINP
jgi:Tol biopolymer transport system component